MKKHPVDDLFSRKLAEWEVTPSPEAWKKIEGRQGKVSHRQPVWYWYAAAGVVIAVLAGYGVWQNQVTSPKKVEGTLAHQTPEQPLPEKQNQASVQAGDEFLTEKEMPVLAYKEKQIQPVDTEKKIQTQSPKKLVEQPADLSISPPVEEQVASITPMEIPQVHEGGKANAITSLPKVTPPTGIMGESQDKATNDRVIIAHIDTEDLSAESQKASKFIRVLRQLKNAKEGEAVDWDEVGFNPKKLVARADERLKNEEEKVSRYYQNLKDKTKL